MSFHGSWVPARLRGRKGSLRVLRGGQEGAPSFLRPLYAVGARPTLTSVKSHVPGHGLPMGPDPKYCVQCGHPLVKKKLKAGEPDRCVCTGCNQVTWIDPKVATGILAMWRDGIVLIRRANEPGYGKWTFPGGFVDRGERVEEAARREAREEAHMEVEDLKLVGVYSYPDSPVVLVTYRPGRILSEPIAGDETLELVSFPVERIPWMELAFRSTHDALRDYVALLKS